MRQINGKANVLKGLAKMCGMKDLAYVESLISACKAAAATKIGIMDYMGLGTSEETRNEKDVKSQKLLTMMSAFAVLQVNFSEMKAAAGEPDHDQRPEWMVNLNVGQLSSNLETQSVLDPFNVRIIDMKSKAGHVSFPLFVDSISHRLVWGKKRSCHLMCV